MKTLFTWVKTSSIRLWKARFHRSGLENISRRRATPPFVTFVASRTRAAELEFDPKFLSDPYR